MKLQIVLDHDDGVVRARSWLKGRVDIFNTDTPIHDGELVVDLIGKEIAFAKAHSVVGNICTIATSCATHTKKEFIIFQEHRILHDFSKQHDENNNKVSYRFSIYMPGALPPTMEFDNTDNGDGYCSVRYQLTAYLTTTTTISTNSSSKQQQLQQLRSKDSSSHHHHVAHTEHVLKIIGEPLSNQKHPYSLIPTCYPLKHAYGLLNSGNVVLAAKVDNTHVAKGEHIQFSLSCRNYSRLPILRVDVHLLEDIQWTTSSVSPSPSGSHITATVMPVVDGEGGGHNGGGGIGKCNRTLTLGAFNNLVMDGLKKEPWVPENNNNNNNNNNKPNNNINKDFNESYSSLYSDDDNLEVGCLTRADMHNDLLLQCNTIQIMVPTKTRDSYNNGKLIKISHYLQIVLVMKGNQRDPHINIPIKIFDPPLAVETGSSTHSKSQHNIDSMANTSWQTGANVIAPMNPFHQQQHQQHHYNTTNVNG